MALTLGGPALIAELVGGVAVGELQAARQINEPTIPVVGRLGRLVVGVAVGVLQAATQINEPTIPFVVKVVGLVVVMAATGHFLLGRMVAFTTDLFHRIPHLIG